MRPPPEVPEASSFEETRRSVTDTVLRCLETDVHVIYRFIELAAYWYKNGHPESGDRARGEAVKGIDRVRRFLSTTKFLSAESKESIDRRCDELEDAVANLPWTP